MSWEPKIVAYVCNWCTYLGADLAGTNRLEYPANVRIIRLPCTGRIDFNLLVKAFEIGADSVLVSGCHPGDCHYTAGNYHARRRWMLFRPLLETLGFDLRRIHFTWISAAEGKKFQHVITEITKQTRTLGPANYLRPAEERTSVWTETAAPRQRQRAPADDLAAQAREMLGSGAVDVVIGYGAKGRPVFVRRPEEAERLTWDGDSRVNLAAYLKHDRPKGRIAVVAPPATGRSLKVLEQEAQIEKDHVVPIEVPEEAGPPDFSRLERFLALPAEDRLAYWMSEFDRCVKCYACRQSCPMCYCERCIADKNRPQAISPSATLEGNFAWQITRAFHLAGRCVGCGECTRACPAGIDLALLNQALAKAALDQFGHRAGVSEPLLGNYRFEDKEDFIR